MSNGTNSASPLIVTLSLDEDLFHFFNQLRQRYFPPERNFLAAHLTLFHCLPANEPKLLDDLYQWSSKEKPFSLQVTEVRSIGKGVAYKIKCDALQALHRKMLQEWSPWLEPQDKQKLWPHITVQNKVTPAVARQTLQELQKDFQPFLGRGTGFQLWSYEGGPWTFIQGFFFKG